MCETAGFLGHFGIACGGWSITGVINWNGVARIVRSEGVQACEWGAEQERLVGKVLPDSV